VVLESGLHLFALLPHISTTITHAHIRMLHIHTATTTAAILHERTVHLTAQSRHALYLLHLVHLSQLSSSEVIHELLIDDIWCRHYVLKEVGGPDHPVLLLFEFGMRGGEQHFGGLLVLHSVGDVEHELRGCLEHIIVVAGKPPRGRLREPFSVVVEEMSPQLALVVLQGRQVSRSILSVSLALACIPVHLLVQKGLRRRYGLL